MLAFAESLQLEFDGAFVHQSPLSWIARNNSKPGRVANRETWVAHAAAEWTESHIANSPEQITELILDAFWAAVGRPRVKPVHTEVHRWRFAIPSEPLAEKCLFDEHTGIGACGDWCGGPRVEGAFLSGMALAGRVLGFANATSQFVASRA